ncbi:nuclear transport factor 2 family protein [Sphingomonas sp. NBWT7]|uniref:YybH family protein n=1 Tax=Sphingomonas sp. NBWT7 TaxID=2596913 RepID=UPI0016262C0E|nr:SgcJ/EcaC family oxidoreductase [Sphingomonas sp. NBWT7]QNE33288.1 nuclear transport factor 2 family protein [Sphingomonas sp. NBWT7]
MPALLIPIIAAAAAVASPQAAIEQALTDSANGWNSGDLDRFMALYADDAVYVSGATVARGRAEIAQRYAKSFAAGANTRGTLRLQPVAWRPLSAVHVILVARWTLAGSAAPQTGLTTLIFERRKTGWQIIADHSS